jgi:hypothetical protein
MIIAAAVALEVATAPARKFRLLHGSSLLTLHQPVVAGLPSNIQLNIKIRFEHLVSNRQKNE